MLLLIYQKINYDIIFENGIVQSSNTRVSMPSLNPKP
jgi:hypothetical protein